MPDATTPARACRILHVANFGYKAKGVYLHGMAAKLSNGFVRAGHHVIPFSDRDVARWMGLGHRKLGAAAANRTLLTLAAETEPDIIAFGHADVITPETVRRLREIRPTARLLQWTADLLTNADTIARVEAKLPHLDATFATTTGPALTRFARPGHAVFFIPNPADRAIDRLRNFEQAGLPDDVFFAASSPDNPRIHAGCARTPNDLARLLADRAPGLRLALAGIAGRPLLFGPDYERALARAKMGLNLSYRNDLPLYSSDRLSHIAGNGLVVLIDRASLYADLVGEEAFAFYGTEDDLFDVAARLAGDDAQRRRIAEAGWRRYHEMFACERVAAAMIDAVEGRLDPARIPWPILPA